MKTDSKIIAEREKIREALSEFLPDTELLAEDFSRIAKVFLSSGCSLQEIPQIDRYEVFPTLQ